MDQRKCGGKHAYSMHSPTTIIACWEFGLPRQAEKTKTPKTQLHSFWNVKHFPLQQHCHMHLSAASALDILPAWPSILPQPALDSGLTRATPPPFPSTKRQPPSHYHGLTITMHPQHGTFQAAMGGGILLCSTAFLASISMASPPAPRTQWARTGESWILRAHGTRYPLLQVAGTVRARDVRRPPPSSCLCLYLLYTT